MRSPTRVSLPLHVSIQDAHSPHRDWGLRLIPGPGPGTEQGLRLQCGLVNSIASGSSVKSTRLQVPGR
eukprot:5863202-Prymnesium_polylepis.1